MKLFRNIVGHYGMICVSRQAQKELCRILNLPEDTPQVKSIYNPTSISLSPLGEQKENLMVYAGRLNIEKRPMLMLKLWQKLYVKYPNWQFIILGDGPERSRMEHYIIQYGLQRIQMPGIVNNVGDYLKRSKISILLSKYEGLPTSILEAAFCHNALVVARNDGGAVDIVADKLNGIIVNANDFSSLVNRVDELMADNGGNAINMGKGNDAVLEKFSNGKILSQWQEILH